MPAIHVPDKAEAQTVDVPIKVSTRISDERVEEVMTRPLPRSLGDAVAVDTEREVFRLYIQQKVMNLQNERRTEMQAAAENSPNRRRAKYLDELGL